tara:strand:- start:226 stop:594 length:369 start_codon:yes stop_codon:yes gene_type:complete
MRIKGHKTFDLLHREGTKFHSKCMTLRVINPIRFEDLALQNASKQSNCRIAIAISNKVSKKSVVRNRLRRIFHDHLRVKLPPNKYSYNQIALISLKSNIPIEEPTLLLEECDRLLYKAGLVS